MWGKADGDPFDPYGSGDPELAPPVRLRSRIGASLVIVALLGATARGGWLVFAGPTRIPTLKPDAIGSQSGRVKQLMPSVDFIVRCQFSHEASDDPILAPGKPGVSHRHSFFGNRTTNALSTAGSLLGRPTTCDDSGDSAAYWLPTPVGERWTAIRAYYGAGQLDPSEIVAYPFGIGIIAGNMPQRLNLDSKIEQRHQTEYQPQNERVTTSPSTMWSCGRAIDEPGWSPRMPKCLLGERVAARIVFGQCLAEPTQTEPVQTFQPTQQAESHPPTRLVMASNPSDWRAGASNPSRTEWSPVGFVIRSAFIAPC
jgi:hypothetical protein